LPSAVIKLLSARITRPAEELFMSNRKYRVGPHTVVFSSWISLLAYGCVAAPADDPTGTGGVSGTGTITGGVSAGGTGGAGVTGGAAPTGGVGQGGAAPTGGISGAGVTGGAAPTGGVAGAGVTGGTGGAGVTGGAAGAGVTGGAGGAPAGAGGTGPAAGAGGVNTDAECTGIKSNMACPIQGKACPNLVCGLGDTGRRECNCATNWTCTSCNFTGSVIATKPATADTPCAAGVVSEAACAMGNDPASVCASTETAGEYCICAINPRNTAEAPQWDCDEPPSSWGM
jgi:hypothetical protein